MKTIKLFVVEKEYATSRLSVEHESDFKWIDERVFGEPDAHVDAKGKPITAKNAAKAELERLRGLESPAYIRGYRLVDRTVKVTDKVLDEQ